MMADNTGSTLLSKRKTKGNVHFTKEEILLILRAYQVHPCSWTEIISAIQDNTNLLSEQGKHLYRNATIRQLKERVSNKLSKLIKDGSEDTDIQQEIDAIRTIEQKNMLQPESPQPGPSVSRKRKSSASASVPTSASASGAASKRDAMAEELSTSDDELPHLAQNPKAKKPKKTEKKKDSLMQLMLQNQQHYNKFITKKVPKLLRAFGISDSSDSE